MNKYSVCECCKSKILIKRLNQHYEKCPKISRKIVNCIYCDSKFQEYNLKKHINICSKNPKNFRTKFNAKIDENLDEKEYFKCQFCNSSVFRKNLKKHENKCLKKNINIFKECQFCKKHINLKDLENHEINCPEILKELIPSKYNFENKIYTGDNVYITNDDGIVEFLGKKNRSTFKLNNYGKTLKNVDSYYNSNKNDNISFSVRENGKFGSMPLYDNYEEESNF